MLAHGAAWQNCIDSLADCVRPHAPDVLIGIESRGFLVTAPLALELGCGFIMVRKNGKLPGSIVGHTYELEYGTDTIEIQSNAIEPGQRIVVMDDLLATGGTMAAAIALAQKVGGDVRAACCIIELSFLKGREKLAVPFDALLTYEK